MNIEATQHTGYVELRIDAELIGEEISRDELNSGATAVWTGTSFSVGGGPPKQPQVRCFSILILKKTKAINTK